MSTPPRPSYRVSSPSIITAPRLSSLEVPVRINFDSPWRKGTPLFDWYHRRTSRLIHTMQLRREDESPFFHEYVVFSLGPNGGYFRVDRRQKPDESARLNSISEQGVEAYDTIEEITSLEDRMYCSSRCLVSVNFGRRVPLALLLSVARVIQQHKNACIYTLQRYNCYFFAQTMVICIARNAARGRCGTAKSYEAQLSRNRPRKIKRGRESEGTDILGPLRLLDRVARRRTGLCGSLRWLPTRDPEDDIEIQVRPDRIRTEPRDQSAHPTFNQTLSYIEHRIDRHSERVERFRPMLRCSAMEVSSDIKAAMRDIAREICG